MRRTLMIAAVCSGLSAGQFALAQAPPAASREGTGQLSRPQPAMLQVQQLSPEMEQILKEWEAKSQAIVKLEGEHSRIVVDKVFNVEKHSTGIFYYEAPDKGRIDLDAVVTTPGQMSTKRPDFAVQSDRPEKWICTGKVIYQIHDDEKTYEVLPIPAANQGKNIMHGPLPFLFGMPAEMAKLRFTLTLIEGRNTPTQAWISAKPLLAQDAVSYREALIILDKKDYLPMAVKLIDPSGNKETIYQFSNVKVNGNGGFNILKIWKGNPFDPNLRGYTLIQAPELPLIEGEGAAGAAPPRAAAIPAAPPR